MRRTAFKVAYIGSNFSGFQRQPDVRTVEGDIINTLMELEYIEDLKDARFRIAGRTDAGVNSLGNVVSFQSEKELHINKINRYLPEDVQFLAQAPVRFGFKPRYAKQRWYRYVLFRDDLDIDRLNEMASLFEGSHNFTNFTKRYQKTTTRTIDRISVTVPDIGEDERLKSSFKTNNFTKQQNFPHLNNNYSPIFIDVYGESFLWNMIRKMMRVFVEYSCGNMSYGQVEDYLNPKEDEPRAHIKVLEAENLILMDTIYDKINFQYDDYAVEKFKRYLASKLIDYQRSYGIVECILNSF